jgi:GTP-binding protein
MKRHTVVSLVGRPNVGKSSLFNAILRRQNKALTYDRPGVTRDRHYAVTSIDENKGDLPPANLIMIDTGGFYPEQLDENQENDKENKSNHFFNRMIDHAKIAIDESDLVLLVVDVREGILPIDEKIADYVRTCGKACWVIANKYDSDNQAGEEAAFFALGVEDLMVTSAAHGLGIVDLREKIQEFDFNFQAGMDINLQKGLTPREEVVSRLAIIGAPNAGKSTLLNQLLGAQRALVSNIAGTTVDPIEGYFDLYFGQQISDLNVSRQHYTDQKIYEEYDNFRANNPEYRREQSHLISQNEDFEKDLEENLLYEQVFETEMDEVSELSEVSKESEDQIEENEINPDSIKEPQTGEEDPGSYWRSVYLVDTAGIRRKSLIQDTVEAQSVYRSLRCISDSDIVIQLVDATKGISHQDRRLVDIALEKGKSVVIALNKVDLLKEKLKTEKDRREWLEDLRYDIPWLQFCDLIPISALEGRGIKALKKALVKTILVRHRKLGTGELNRLVQHMVEVNPVIVKKSGGKRLKIKYSSMIKSAPPTFLMFSNKSKGIPENYKRYLKNGLRREFQLYNSPIHLIFRTSTELEKRAATNSSHNRA